MANYNRATLAGNLTRDPEIRYVQISGDEEVAVTEFTLAVNRTRSEGVDYIQTTAWRGLAEIIDEYKKKGDGILVEGRLQYSSWEAEDGSKRSKVSVVAENVQFLEIAGANTTSDDDDDFEDLEDSDYGEERPAPPPAKRKRPAKRSASPKAPARKPKKAA